MSQYHVTFGHSVSQFTVTDPLGNPVIPYKVQPAIRGPLMVQVTYRDSPVSLYELIAGESPEPGHRWCPVDRNYKSPSTNVAQVPIEQLDREHRAREGAGRPSELKLRTLKRIVKLLHKQTIKQVAAKTGVSESMVSQISSGKAYWYVR